MGGNEREQQDAAAADEQREASADGGGLGSVVKVADEARLPAPRQRLRRRAVWAAAPKATQTLWTMTKPTSRGDVGYPDI